MLFREKLRVVSKTLALDECDDLFNDFVVLQHLHISSDNVKDDHIRNSLKGIIEDFQSEIGDKEVK